ncbi:ferritin [Candidatus Dependentiae bacterium]|nr:ferritin [Candidatus Dependentiae bacterium]MBU4387213.1 ferritin [Candidatus Dependentiae bacterium]MCG2756001.1 ferritin [Candidatus Dependentiae bacterium]
MKDCCNIKYLLLFMAILVGLFFVFKKKFFKKIRFNKTIISKVVSAKDKEILKLLNKALADEWLAYYQYWVGSKIVKGEFSKEAVVEMVQHASDEKRHADMLTEHILKLGGIPILDFYKLEDISGCGYTTPPALGDIKIILEQNIEGERCAIKFYKNFLTQLNENYQALKKDIETILKDEEEHEVDLNDILKNIIE